MTVPYNFDVRSSTWLKMTKILLRWKGSMWKAVCSEFLLWVFLYSMVNISLRTMFNDNQVENFKLFRTVLTQNLSRIPITFLLGFFVTVVFNRWTDIFKKIGFIENLALAVSTAINGDDDETKYLKRKIVRYAVLAQTLVFRDISSSVRGRFPNTYKIVEAGIMTPKEYQIIESNFSSYTTNWLPFQWAMRLIWDARAQGKIGVDVIAWQLCEKIKEFRTDLTHLCSYDWIPVPLSYLQIVFLAVRSYFLLTIIARQTLACDNFDVSVLITFLELLLLIGWVKVAEMLLNPFGTDDDDFECNYVIDRNFMTGLEIVDQTYNANSLPGNDADQFWNVKNPLPLDQRNNKKNKIDPYIGSVAVADAEGEIDNDEIGEEFSEKKTSTNIPRRRGVSFKATKDQPSKRHQSIDPINELSLQTLHSSNMPHTLDVVEEEGVSGITDSTEISARNSFSSTSLPKRE